MLLFWNTNRPEEYGVFLAGGTKLRDYVQQEEGCVQVWEGISEYPVNKVTQSAFCHFYQMDISWQGHL